MRGVCRWVRRGVSAKATLITPEWRGRDQCAVFVLPALSRLSGGCGRAAVDGGCRPIRQTISHKRVSSAPTGRKPLLSREVIRWRSRAVVTMPTAMTRSIAFGFAQSTAESPRRAFRSWSRKGAAYGIPAAWRLRRGGQAIVKALRDWSMPHHRDGGSGTAGLLVHGMAARAGQPSAAPVDAEARHYDLVASSMASTC